MDLLEEGNEVVLAESMEFVRTFSTPSRPALRTATGDRHMPIVRTALGCW